MVDLDNMGFLVFTHMCCLFLFIKSQRQAIDQSITRQSSKFQSFFELPMAFSKVVSSVILVAFFLSSTSTLAFPGPNPGSSHGGGFGGGYAGLCPEFYEFSCPQANDIVMSVLEKAIGREPRMAASLLRLHFHDCFVQVLQLIHISIDYIYTHTISTDILSHY